MGEVVGSFAVEMREGQKCEREGWVAGAATGAKGREAAYAVCNPLCSRFLAAESDDASAAAINGEGE